MLQALQTVVMTEVLLRESKIGVTVYETKKKFAADNRVHIQSKNLITSWKKVVEKKTTAETSSKSTTSTKTDVKAEPIENISKTSSSSSSSSSSETTITAATVVTQKTEEDDDENDGWGTDEKYLELPQSRKKIVDVMIDHLKLSTTSADLAKFWSLWPYDSSTRQNENLLWRKIDFGQILMAKYLKII